MTEIATNRINHRIVDLLPSVPRRLLEPGAVAAAQRLTEARLANIRDTWDGKSGRLVLGQTGRCKSVALAMAAKRLAIARARGDESVPRVLWCRADELARSLKERGGSEEVAKAKNVGLLIIDDVGWESFHETLTEVIAVRYDRSKATAVTSGLEQDGFIRRYGDALVRRIVEVGNGGVVDLWGKA